MILEEMWQPLLLSRDPGRAHLREKSVKTSANGHDVGDGRRRKLRSSEWFNDPHNPAMTALYLERYLNYGLTRELQSGKPIIGIAQTGSDLSPCNRHHLE